MLSNLIALVMSINVCVISGLGSYVIFNLFSTPGMYDVKFVLLINFGAFITYVGHRVYHMMDCPGEDECFLCEKER